MPITSVETEGLLRVGRFPGFDRVTVRIVTSSESTAGMFLWIDVNGDVQLLQLHDHSVQIPRKFTYPRLLHRSKIVRVRRKRAGCGWRRGLLPRSIAKIGGHRLNSEMALAPARKFLRIMTSKK